MKLKIIDIQELIDKIDYPERPSEYNFEGYKYRLYEQKDSFLSQEIADSIIPFYLKNVCNKTFSRLYKIFPYNSLQEKTYGFYLGIPYYKVDAVEEVCKVKEEALVRELNTLKDEFTDFEHICNRKIGDFETEIQKQVVENRKKEEVEQLKYVKEAIEKAQSSQNFWNVRLSERWSNEKYESYKYWKDQVAGLQLRQAYHQEQIKNMSDICKKEKADLQKEKADLQKELEDRRKEFINAKRKKLNGLEYLDETVLQYKKSVAKKYKKIADVFESAQQNKIDKAQKYQRAYAENDAVAEFLCFILQDSFYPFEFECNPTIEYNDENKLLVVDYYLPSIDDTPNIKEIKEYKTKSSEIKYLSKTELNRLYDELIYKIIIRSIAEIFHFDDLKKVDTVCFNGRLKTRNQATGQLMDNCILSVQVNRQEFEAIDLKYVDCKACFKHFKGVSGAKLHDQSPIVPLIQLDKTDKRFVEAHAVETDTSTNLATMDWEEFEHLVRELFDLEFNVNGGEVKITQASRDGGVDAVAFDPDPIRGGKIVIQAKRYTNTVGCPPCGICTVPSSTKEQTKVF